MEYADLVSVYERLEATSGTHAKTDILAEALASADEGTLDTLVLLVRGRVFPNWDSTTLGVSSSLVTDAVVDATGVPEARIEDWWREAGDLGDAAAEAVRAKTQATLVSRTLTVESVHETLAELAGYEGSGSQDRKVKTVAGLVGSADPAEARWVVRTVLGAMRLGVGEGILRDAVAQAFLDGPEAADAVERAYEVTNDFALVARTASREGVPALESLAVRVFRPIKPMLAGKAESIEDALADLGDADGVALLETKYDGVRAKLHADGDAVRMFTRRLDDVSAQFPDVIAATREAVAADRYILEAEVVGYDPDTGDPVPFQELSQRIQRREDVAAMAEEIPVTVHVFDCLLRGEESLLEEPLRDRLAALDAVFDPVEDRIERAAHRRFADVDAAREFYESTVAAGHEGLMVKNLDATYQPGSRVGYQLKVKSTMEPLDLVVTRAKWSEGRKSDFLGRPYLACRDPEADAFREVGRMHTGFTDAQLEEFTALIEPLIQSVDGREADLTPEVVLEVEYEEIQSSPKYDSGYALRFPRLSEIRPDLAPEDADTIETVERLYEEQ
jgi:DNA ligase-1